MTIVVVGASAGLGRALAEEFARRRHSLVLMARDLRDLTAVRLDLQVRFGVSVRVMVLDLADRSVDLAAVAAEIGEEGQIEGLYVPAGLSRRDDNGELDTAAMRTLFDANLTGIACFVAAMWPSMIASPRATLACFGSVAAERGRRQNIVYAAAKRGLLSLCESLRHLAGGSSVCVQTFQVSFLDTQQSFGKKTLLPKASPRAAAHRVVALLHRDCGTVWLPWPWRMIAFVVRRLPWFVFRRLDF